MTTIFNKEKFRVMLVSGYTLKEIGEEFGVTKQAVGLWRKKYYPHLQRDEFGASKRKADALLDKKRKYKKHDSVISRAKAMYFSRKKQNCRWNKIPFNLTYEDIEWNEVCPVFGTEIDWLATKMNENSPSMDRMDSSLGYIPGNVCIISWRANRIKNDGNRQEHLQIARYIRRHTCKSS